MREGFVLIGAGLSRTGTNSTRKALVELLGGDCYHGWTISTERPDHHKHFRKALRGEATAEDWREVLKDYKAGLDIPINLFYKELMEIFPDAKVLLTVRDPVSWYVSMRDTIVRTFSLKNWWPYSWFIHLRGKQIQVGADLLYHLFQKQKSLDAVNAGEESAVKFWEEHVKEVMEHVPEERLLVWSVKEGWGPLCKFLDVPQPEEAFPRSNDAKEMQRRTTMMMASAWLMVVVLPMVMAVLGYFCCEDPGKVVFLLLTGLLVAVMVRRNANRDITKEWHMFSKSE